MGSWIKPNTYTGIPEPEPFAEIKINGYTLYRPGYFKNKAQARAFEIALVLAQKKPLWSGVTIMTTSECIDTIMFNGVPDIHLDINAVTPSKVAKDAMKYVPKFFDPGVVVLDKLKNCKKMWYLEIFRTQV
jgi:hypothetical protein